MKTCFVSLASSLLLLSLSTVEANNIQIDPGPPGIVFGERRISFGDLNGVKLEGQTLSLDFTFARGEFLNAIDPNFDFLVILHTDATGTLNEPTSTAWIFDKNNRPLQSPFSLGGGSVTGNPGELLRIGTGLFPPTLIDFYGAHFDLTLPNAPLAQITGSEVLFAPNGGLGRFEIGPHIPDSMSTVWLAVPMAFLLLYRKASYRTLDIETQFSERN